MRFSPGDSVGPYRVTAVIGEGATGVVYQVVNGVTGRFDAMKVLTDDVSNDLEQVERFLHEIQLQAKLEHPNIAQVRTAFCEGRTLIMVMEQVGGEALDLHIERGLPAPIETMRIIDQVLQALGYAHSKGVIHRDVKPGNILVGKDGQVKLTDFGLARQQSDPSKTLPGVAVGTVYYMSPEQVRAFGPIDGRSDLYSAGIVFYEMLTGRKPFDGAEQFAIMRAQVELMPPPPSFHARFLPPAVDQVLAKALQKDPALRYQTADEFRAAVAALPSAWMIPPAPPKRFTGAVKFGAVMCGTAILVLSAFALPPWISSYEPAIETLDLKPPAPPPPPADALVLPAKTPEPAAVAPPALARPTVRQVVSPPKPFAATRILNADSEPVTIAPPPPPRIEPVPLQQPVQASPPPPSAPPVSEPAPASAAPQVKQPESSQEPNWMRRTVRGFPRLFRRKPAESDPGKPKQ
ncbi:MAG: serine/threonine-protein kinase [Bryobacteraceae bacterium]